MTAFTVSDPTTGRTVRLTSNTGQAPTEQELEQVFANVPQQSPFQDLAPVLGKGARTLVPWTGNLLDPFTKPLQLAEPFLKNTPAWRMIAAPFERTPATPVGKAMATGAEMAPTVLGLGAGSVQDPLANEAGIAGKGLKAIFRPRSYENEVTQVAQRARGGYQQFLSSIPTHFRNAMEQLGGAVNIRPHIEQLMDIATNPDSPGSAALADAMRQAAKVGDTTLERFLNNPSLAESATPLEAHQVATTLGQTKTALRFLSRNPNAAQSGAKILSQMGQYDQQFNQIANGIGSQITALHPDKYPAILKAYQAGKNTEAVLTPEFAEKGNRLFTNIKEGFGGGEVMGQVKSALPTQTIRQIQQIASAQRRNPFVQLGKLAGTKKFLGR